MNYVKWVLAGFIAAGLVSLGYHMAASAGKAQLAQVQRDYANERLTLATNAAEAESRARKADQDKAVALAAIAAQHEQDKTHAQHDQDQLVADLRTGAVRLRDQWATCRATSEVLVASGSLELDAAARDRESSAARVVRAARDADDTIRALQATLTKERQ